jgi:hypothetical protein
MIYDGNAVILKLFNFSIPSIAKTEALKKGADDAWMTKMDM